MNNLLKYKGFKAKIEFSADDNVLFGHLLGIEDIVSFHGETVEEVKQAFQESVDFHIEVCEKIGKRAKKNYSGKVMLRLPGKLHERIAEMAESSGKSINEWGKEVFESAVKS
ncbi:MAG: type II toxin-antitoxin system HicB family antitoxin [Saprospiraceae bacterium]|nr:type II toxin-antitoxin system HicB family antitoxin [Pyrinomonadaceae bacterium]